MSAVKVIFKDAKYITLDITIFNNGFSTERDYECHILLCRILSTFTHTRITHYLK